MRSAEYNLNYLTAGLEQLEQYLLADGIYWPIGISAKLGQPPYPQLTLGNLLLAKIRAECSVINSAQQARLTRLTSTIEAISSKWKVAWENKSRSEIRARLTLLRNFLEEFMENPAANYDRYPYEVGRRVLVELLMDEAGEIYSPDEDILVGLDRIIKSRLISGDFIWDSNLADKFPADRYWFLYGRLSSG